MQEIKEECRNDRSWIPYDAMGDYSVFTHPAEGKPANKKSSSKQDLTKENFAGSR